MLTGLTKVAKSRLGRFTGFVLPAPGKKVDVFLGMSKRFVGWNRLLFKRGFFLFADNIRQIERWLLVTDLPVRSLLTTIPYFVLLRQSMYALSAQSRNVPF